MEKQKILVADDEVRITELIRDFLSASGFEAVVAFNGADALKIFEKEKNISLALLDIMMPEIDGWQVCKEIRSKSDIPIIMLTARAEEFDQLLAFENGADEYVTKPFSPAVLVKRVEALLKRSDVNKDNANKTDLVIDREGYTAYFNGLPLSLTLKEFEVLQYLADNAAHVISRDQILNAVWGWDFDGDNRTVDSHVARIRTKLGDYGTAYLKTIYGVGYRFDW